MKNTNRFAAAALAFAIAAVSTGCSAPSGPTIGNGTKNALTIDGYDVPAGIFITYELTAYNSAASQYISSTSAMPTPDDIKKFRIGGTDASTWIQDQATEQCRQFVAIEKEFDKINGTLTDEEEDMVNSSVKSLSEADRDFYEKNGVGDESLKKIAAFEFKVTHVFEHYYGIDRPNGCTEDELKQYYLDNNARVKYIEIKTADSQGNKYDEDTIHDLEKLADSYVKQINAEKDNDDKLAKVDELQEAYTEYAATITTTVSGQTTSATTTTTTTTTTTDASATTTTTTTDPHANEKIIAKITTTTAAANSETVTTTPVEKTDAEKASEAFDTKLFGSDMPLYTAERYQYDDDTIYVIIKADLEERINADDLWTEDFKEALIQNRYASVFADWIEEIAKGYSVEKNKSAYKRYEPFDKLELEK